VPIVRPSPSSVLAPGSTVARHVHLRAYATVVLDGGYQEAGECGRWRVQAGDVLIHAPISAHWDHVAPGGARVINLALPDSIARSACGHCVDLDLVLRLAPRDPLEAAEALLHGWRAGKAGLGDVPDLLARTLAAPDPPGVEAWADGVGVSRATAFRWFRATYGIAPTVYRVESRARLAWRMIVDSAASLADIAAAAGYADQSHMSRDVRRLTGHSPGAWRTRDALQHSFKTGTGKA
jgi:AraC-like DNA-binding protein